MTDAFHPRKEAARRRGRTIALVGAVGTGSVLALGATSVDGPSAPPKAPSNEAVVPERYIVVLHDSVAPQAVADTARELTDGAGGQVRDVYQNVLHGFSVHANAEQVRQLAEDGRVDRVEPAKQVGVLG